MQKNNLIHIKARSRSLSLSASKYWQKLNYYIEARKAGDAQMAVDELRKDAMKVVRSLDHLSNILYKKYHSQIIEYKSRNENEARKKLLCQRSYKQKS